MTFKNLIWPFSFALMCFLVSNKSVITIESVIYYTVIGAVVGVALSLVMSWLVKSYRLRLAIDVSLGVLWALVIFSIGYPDLYVPHKGYEVSAVVYLALISLLPLILILLQALINRIMTRNTRVRKT